MTAHRSISTANAVRIGQITTPRATPGPEPTVGFRTALQMAFRRLGVSVAEATAYARTKGFYRRSGADWTRALG